MVSELLGINGIGAATAEQLEQHGVNSIEELAAMDVAQLKTVPGFGEVRAASVLANARETLRAMEEKPEPPVAKKGKSADKKAVKKKKKKGKPAKKKSSKGKDKKDKKKAKGKKKKKSQKEKKGKDKKKK